ncbi:MAG: Fe-S-cluster containining protein [Myxococcota bacterium]|jgi:Fe-S-cluster containining protein
MAEFRTRSGCARCTTARCCLRFDPELTGYDLYRIMKGRALAFDDVARWTPTRADQAEDDAIFLVDDIQAFEIRLRRTHQDGTAVGNGGPRRCGLLVSVDEGVNRCGVYAHRPMRCRTFPTEDTPYGVVVRTPESICPPGAWIVSRVDLGARRKVHTRAAFERALHRRVLGRWNQAQIVERPIGAAQSAYVRAALAFYAAIEADIETWLNAESNAAAGDVVFEDAVATALTSVFGPLCDMLRT